MASVRSGFNVTVILRYDTVILPSVRGYSPIFTSNLPVTLQHFCSVCILFYCSYKSTGIYVQVTVFRLLGIFSFIGGWQPMLHPRNLGYAVSVQSFSITVNHCQPLSNHCQPLFRHSQPKSTISTTLNHCQPLSTTVQPLFNHSQPLSTTVNHCQPLLTTVNHCQPLSTTLNHSQPLSTTVQPLSTTFNHCSTTQPLPTTV